MAHPSDSPYDVNFCFPVPNSLENDRLKLVPFIPNIHGEDLFAGFNSFPHLFDYMPYGPFKSVEEHRTWHETVVNPNPAAILFVVYDKTKGGSLAGSIGYLNASAENLCVEIGLIITFPSFQRTYVTSNAIGLLVHYALDLPSQGGLGLRRVVWQAHALNEKSVNAAKRLGFKLEGILRFDRVLPPGKPNNGRGERAGDPKAGWGGADIAMLSVCWDDWEDGGKEHVDAIMARNS